MSVERPPTEPPNIGSTNSHTRWGKQWRDLALALAAEVNEWFCIGCNTVYPGPPSQGFDCVICPKCGNYCGPRVSMELLELKRRTLELERLSGEVIAEMDAWRSDVEKIIQRPVNHHWEALEALCDFLPKKEGQQ